MLIFEQFKIYSANITILQQKRYVLKNEYIFKEIKIKPPTLITKQLYRKYYNISLLHGKKDIKINLPT